MTEFADQPEPATPPPALTSWSEARSTDMAISQEPTDEALTAFAMFCKAAPTEVLLNEFQLRRVYTAYTKAFGPPKEEEPRA